ncbi:MAG TPA: hypothetical protein VKA59_14515 [Vicinamibacterales bacterium]|nr:hypothetical protein [Vicinamibacterales bacterium]
MSDSRPSHARIATFIGFVSAVAIALAAYLYVAIEPAPATSNHSNGIVDEKTSKALTELRRGSYVAFREMALGATYGNLAFASLEPGTPRLFSSLPCHRLHFSDTIGVCLAIAAAPAGFRASLLDEDMRVTQTIGLPGMPSRTRVSRNGEFAAYTVFVSGDSYLASGLSTRTRLLKLPSGQDVADLESFAVLRDGKEIYSLDFNFWGVTFTRDPNRIYATLGTGGKILLVEGEVAERTFRVIAEDIECPSLSPDETHIAFKKRFGSGFDAWWQPAVVDLATMTVRQLPESKHIDDQIEWLDNGHILYAVGHSTSAAVRRADIWTIAIDGASPSSIFLADAESPAVVRR